MKVLSISWSDILLLLSHLKILEILILLRLMFKVKLLGIDLNKFSINPPPVICAAEFIKFLSANLRISFEYILVGFNNEFFKLFGIFFSFQY